MATQTQNAMAVLDALADSLGKTLTNEKKAAIVEEFINQIGGAASNEEKAQEFNTMLVNIIRSTGKAHARMVQEQANAASEQAAEDGANANF